MIWYALFTERPAFTFVTMSFFIGLSMFFYGMIENGLAGSKKEDGTIREESTAFSKFGVFLMFVVFLFICVLPFLGLFLE